jgi:hypothetical protein
LCSSFIVCLNIEAHGGGEFGGGDDGGGEVGKGIQSLAGKGCKFKLTQVLSIVSFLLKDLK